MYFKESHIQLLSEVYPEYDWKPWMFKHSPVNYWNDEKHQREFLDFAAKKLEIKKWEDWYSCNMSTVCELGGKALFLYYETLCDALKKIYPEFSWEKEAFDNKETGYWTHIENQRNFFEKLSKIFNLKSLDEWLTIKQVSDTWTQ